MWAHAAPPHVLPQSVFAHGNLLTDEEVQRMAARGAALAHCPLSNFFYAEKLLPVAQLLGMGVKVRRACSPDQGGGGSGSAEDGWGSERALAASLWPGCLPCCPAPPASWPAACPTAPRLAAKL